MLQKYEIKNRFTDAVMVTAKIEITPDMSWRFKLGLAVKWAVAQRANLYGADLSRADLSGAHLYGANLSGANLYGAHLYGADLSGANLSGANLYGADLSRADLSRADLSGAHLSGANLSGANLYGADLSRADLSGAHLSGANLSGANLYGADLSRAENADLQIARTRILPDEGDIIGWKKCQDGIIVKLKITDGTPRSHAFGRKCRAQYATVLEVFGAEKAYSSHDPKFSYEVGHRVEALNWSENWMEECAGGIHFFITKAEAEAYLHA